MLPDLLGIRNGGVAVCQTAVWDQKPRAESLQVHDIEDLCRFGKSVRGCPYYAARHFAGGKLSSLFYPDATEVDVCLQTHLIQMLTACKIYHICVAATGYRKISSPPRASEICVNQSE